MGQASHMSSLDSINGEKDFTFRWEELQSTVVIIFNLLQIVTRKENFDVYTYTCYNGIDLGLWSWQMSLNRIGTNSLGML